MLTEENDVATTQSKSTNKSTTAAKKKAAARGKTNALAILEKDHREVERLVAQFEKAKDDAQKTELAQKICLELKIHAEVEEEFLYPMAREETGEDHLVNEAQVEHQTAKMLIKEIEAAKATDEMFEARVKVLGEYVKHHVKEEENELFPKIRKSDMDLEEVGAQLAARKEELMRQLKGDA
jgi:hemerythrin superfamily protein